MIAVLSLAATSCLKDNDLDKGRIQATTGSAAPAVRVQGRAGTTADEFNKVLAEAIPEKGPRLIEVRM